MSDAKDIAEDAKKGTVSDAVEAVAVTSAGAVKKPMSKIDGRDWKSMIVFYGGLFSIITGLFASVGSGWGLWDFTTGLGGLTIGMAIAAAVLIFALIFFLYNRWKRQSGNRFMHWLGVIFALLYIGWIGSYVIKANSLPQIHDISTDLADPPVFKTLSLREDNWDDIPGADDADMKGQSAKQRWRTLHQGAYADIRSLRIEQPVKAVLEKAERLAETRGWNIATIRVAEGRMEATDTTALFRFKDDIVLRVRATEDGKGSIIDMRSVSRVGRSDIGVNADRIRSFFADLKQ